MIDINNKKRIIGDFLEINAEILQYQLGGKNFIEKKYRQITGKNRRNKLLKIVSDFRKSNYVLTKDNITELLISVYNNFPPKGNYKVITFSKINPDDQTQIEGVIEQGKLDDYFAAIIRIDTKEDEFDLNIHCSDYNKENNYHIQLKKLETDNSRFKELINYLNELLLTTMCDYLENIIKKY